MSLVRVVSPQARHDARVRYTPEDWRIDTDRSGRCEICREPATFHAPETAECVRCGFWFDGLVTGCRHDDMI